jgi:hypothetical protein
MRYLQLDTVIHAGPSRERDRALALVAARILEPAAKLATGRSLRSKTCHHTLGTELQLGALNENDLDAAMDWLVAWPGVTCGRAPWCCMV